MNKQVLSPFDCDMCAMIEDITKQEIEVTAFDTSIRLSWAQNGSDGNDKAEAQRIEALKQAIRGRLGDRFIEFFYADNRQSVYMKYDPEEYPEEMRTKLTDPDATAGSRYCRTLLEVDAIQFRRDNVDDVLRFTGGGTVTTPRTPDGKAMFSFPDGNGIFVDVPESWFIIRELNGRFTARPEKDFKREFEPKGIHTVGNYDGKPIFPRIGMVAIATERNRQIELGRTPDYDNHENAAGELLDVAAALIKNDPEYYGRSGWSWDWWYKTTNKSEKERLAIAGALLAAEIDREEMNAVAYAKEISEKQNKGCGDCANFTNEDINGNGYCEAFKSEQSCGVSRCQEYKPRKEVNNEL